MSFLRRRAQRCGRGLELCRAAGVWGHGDVGWGGGGVPLSQEQDGSRCPGRARGCGQILADSARWHEPRLVCRCGCRGLSPRSHRSLPGSHGTRLGGDGRCFALPCGCGGRYEASIPSRAAAQTSRPPGESHLHPVPGCATPCQAVPCCTVSRGRFDALPGSIQALCPSVLSPSSPGRGPRGAEQVPHPG